MATQQSEPERNGRISVPNIATGASRWYLAVFTAIAVYLTVSNTLFIVATQRIVGWQAVQYVVTGELLKAGGVALITSPIIVEVGRMVIAGIWSERRERKAREEGREEGRLEYHVRWETWLRRLKDAEAKGIPFDEPPPPPPEPESR